METEIYNTLLVDLDNGICTITMNRPHKRNALSKELVNELIYCLEQAGESDLVRVIVLEGSEGTFCTGADLSGMAKPLPKGPDAVPHRGGFVELNLAFTTIGKPVIAKIRKYALGGGLGLVCAAHFAFAEESAQLGTPEIHVGLFPMMIMANIFRTVGKRAGLEMILAGERISATDAARMGLINEAVPSDELDACVSKWANLLADRPPAVMKLGLRAYHAQDHLSVEDALPYLETQLHAAMGTKDAQKGLMAFLNKTKPNWRD
ncbi:MAG: enoyl-CoA hydratase/isomerase family protein [Bradymonadia bacterium]